MSKTKSARIAEFGDFQTPPDLAWKVCQTIRRRLPSPRAIVEPNCGRGAFLRAAADAFPDCEAIHGREIDPAYVQRARRAVRGRAGISICRADFFQTDWPALFAELPQPILVLGNPPWVTNAGLGRLAGSNLPAKSNWQRHAGLDARTGKSNFDISEWMLIRLLQALCGKHALLAMLCKASVARKVLLYAWQHDIPLEDAACYRIDAGEHFGVVVEASLLVCDFAPGASRCRESASFDTLESTAPSSRIGYRDGQLVSDVGGYCRNRGLGRQRSPYRWRSGIKHDCGRVMELVRDGDAYRNGLGERVSLESRYLYPLRKSSQLAAGGNAGQDRWMLVPQRSIGQDT